MYIHFSYVNISNTLYKYS